MSSIFPEGSEPRPTDKESVSLVKLLESMRGAMDADGSFKPSQEELTLLESLLAAADDPVELKPGQSVAVSSMPAATLAPGQSVAVSAMPAATLAPGQTVGISSLPNTTLDPNNINFDAGGRMRVSQLTTLFDGKTLIEDSTLIFSNAGTGTGTYAANKYLMSVTPGQYRVRQAKRFSPYFSGKGQFTEFTMDKFQTEVGVLKRFGYFSSDVAAPFDTSYDGFWVENSPEDGLVFKASRAGAVTINRPVAQWLLSERLAAYNPQFFNVWAIDFLWLGGAICRIFLKTANGFQLVHVEHYSNNVEDVFILNPNQPVRYEIRSTSGTGSFRYICSQVSTEGSVNEEGYNGSVNTGHTLISLQTIGTTYPIKGIRKKSTHRNTSVKLTGIQPFVGTANDQALWSLQINPTLSAPLTYADGTETSVEQAVGNGVITVTTPGRIIASGYLESGSVINPQVFEKDYLAYLGCNIDGTRDPLVLCITPITALSCGASINFKESTN